MIAQLKMRCRKKKDAELEDKIIIYDILYRICRTTYLEYFQRYNRQNVYIFCHQHFGLELLRSLLTIHISLALLILATVRANEQLTLNQIVRNGIDHISARNTAFPKAPKQALDIQSPANGASTRANMDILSTDAYFSVSHDNAVELAKWHAIYAMWFIHHF